MLHKAGMARSSQYCVTRAAVWRTTDQTGKCLITLEKVNDMQRASRCWSQACAIGDASTLCLVILSNGTYIMCLNLTAFVRHDGLGQLLC